MSSYQQIAKEAEVDLNTYQSKTGRARPEGDDEGGVNSMAEKKFESAQVQTGDELSTNSGYNKRIPPSEGGELDDKGRQTRGEQFEGQGGPEDKFAQRPGGDNDGDVVPGNVSKVSGLGSADDIATQGAAASANNVGRNPDQVGQ